MKTAATQKATPAQFEASPAQSQELAQKMRSQLCAWFARNRRDLPWRRTSDPYAIWVSEAMLQQTRVETVIPYWKRFIERLPTSADLARVSDDELLALWSGLGYYRRARSLRLAAIEIQTRFEGRFPDLLEDALSLPGVGPYTAGAVISIAYDLPLPVVDGNVSRVFSRMFGLKHPWGSPALARASWKLAGELMSLGSGVQTQASNGPGAWNQALMELGATTCTLRGPVCAECPLEPQCVARERGDVDRFPVPGPRRASIEVRLEVLLIARRGQLLLEQRPQDGRMAGLWECPTRELQPSGAAAGETRLYPADFGPRGQSARPVSLHTLAELRHSITKHRISAVVRAGEQASPAPIADARPARWVSLEEAESMALTGMTSKLLKRAAIREFLFESANR